jgi:hypothetical protein
MLELFGADESITPEEFVQYKFALHYSRDSIVAQLVHMHGDAHMPDAETARAQAVNRSWDMSTDPGNTCVARMVYTLNALAEKYPGSMRRIALAGDWIIVIMKKTQILV